MIRNNHYFSTNRALWNHIDFSAVHEIRNRKANENTPNAADYTKQVVAKTAKKDKALSDL